MITACTANQPIDDFKIDDVSGTVTAELKTPSETENPPEKAEIIAKQILNGNDDKIHYTYCLLEDNDESKTYPLMMAMPGYDMMWFGGDSLDSNLSWKGFRV